MSDLDTQRDIGRIEARVEELLDWRDEMREWCKKQDASMEFLTAKVNRAEGGLRMLLGVGTVAGAIGSAVTALWLQIKGSG